MRTEVYVRDTLPGVPFSYFLLCLGLALAIGIWVGSAERKRGRFTPTYRGGRALAEAEARYAELQADVSPEETDSYEYGPVGEIYRPPSVPLRHEGQWGVRAGTKTVHKSTCRHLRGRPDVGWMFTETHREMVEIAQADGLHPCGTCKPYEEEQ